MLNLGIHAQGKVRLQVLKALTAIGGEEATGIAIKGLKYRDDYAVVSPTSEGYLVHPIRGKAKGPVELHAGESVSLADLTLFSILPPQEQVDADEGEKFSAELLSLLENFARTDGLQPAMQQLLETALRAFAMEKGMVIARQTNGKYTMMARQGLRPNDPWLSESLIQEALKNKGAILIQNIVGSGFDTKKSLLATGFVSAFVWPLVVRGNVLGTLFVGSAKPHSGLSKENKQKARLFSQLAALMLSFHLHDQKVKEEIRALRATIKGEKGPFLTSDRELIETVQTASKIAPTDLAVLIQGETGVGKEVMADWLHRQSERKNGPLVAVNCGAIPGELLESILFGHVKGAFTGAHTDQVGKFQQAHGGTLFLDEIGDLPARLQVKLLRVLQEKIVEPLGGKKPIQVDVRVVSASLKSIPELVEKGDFREDLYFRLAEIVLTIPPLRSRPQDITLLATNFLKNAGLGEKRLSAEAWDWLKEQKWPGNVRELFSSLKRAAVLTSGNEIQLSQFLQGRPYVKDSAGANWLGGSNLEEAKTRFILSKVHEALRRTDGNRNRAAELLGITPRTLFRYLEEDRKLSENRCSTTEVTV